jgi:hypothetical protein
VRLNREDKMQILLTPSTFKKMLELPNPTKMLNMLNVDAFIEACSGNFVIMNKWLVQSKLELANMY